MTLGTKGVNGSYKKVYNKTTLGSNSQTSKEWDLSKSFKLNQSSFRKMGNVRPCSNEILGERLSGDVRDADEKIKGLVRQVNRAKRE